MDKESKQYTKNIINKALNELWYITNTAEAPESADEDVIENYDDFNSSLDEACQSLEEARDSLDYL